ncbi:MAG: hypothetical protein WCP06_12355, partial [Verrucomicrobiota bacterium]
QRHRFEHFSFHAFQGEDCYQNLAFALLVILSLVVSALGFHLPLPYGVVGHEGSTVLVCLNGLRLLAFRGRG